VKVIVTMRRGVWMDVDGGVERDLEESGVTRGISQGQLQGQDCSGVKG
jgi:hypothetical protein